MTSLCTLVYGEVHDLPMCVRALPVLHIGLQCAHVCVCVCVCGGGMHAFVYLCMVCIRM